MNFFRELRRRRVIRVAMVYAIVAWLLAQIGALLFDTYGAPEWVQPVFVGLLILGFPIALVLAWAFEITPEGVQPTRTVEEGGSQVKALGRSRFDYAIIGLLVVAVGWLLYRAEINPSQPETDQPPAGVLHNSIAVLPFENLSPNPEDAYFAAGMHEEVLNQLAKIRDLSVIARTTMLRYADSELAVPDIGKELKVGAVMEGSVRYDGERVRITAQLIDVGSGVHLWSETYDRDLENIFAIQSDIAERITDSMKVEFSIEEQQAIAKAPTNNLQAFEHYLRALARPTDISVPIDHHRDLDAAIALDPDFAVALGYKAFIYAWQITGTADIVPVTPESQNQNKQQARLYAQRALAIDPDQADALIALAFVDFVELQWASGDAKIERAYRVNPSSATAVLVYGHGLTIQGQTSEAVEIYQQAFALDPQNWPGVYYASANQSRFGDLAVAARLAERVIEMAPNSSYGYSELALVSAMSGDRDKAMAMAQQAELAMDLAPSKYSTLTVMEAFRWLGQPGEVERLFGRLKTIGETNTLTDGDLFRAYFALGQDNRALDHLETAVEARFPTLIPEIISQHAVSRIYAALRGNPRYEAAIRKMNLDGAYPRPSPPPVMNGSL